MSFASRFRRLPSVIQTRIRQLHTADAGNQTQRFGVYTRNFKSVNTNAFARNKLSTLANFGKVENKGGGLDEKLGNETEFVERKGAEVMQLTENTNKILSQYNNVSSSACVTGEMAAELLNNMEKWYELTASIVIPKEYNKRNRFVYLANERNTLQYKADELKLLKLTCAENMDELLKYHIDYNIPSEASQFSEEKDVTHPFSIVMDAWSQSSSNDAGKMTAAVLDRWGEVYGGDLTHAPTINEFNVVLGAHAKNASENYDQYNNQNDKLSFPAELAWDTFSFLCQLNDNALLPNATSCAYTINALSHHAFVMRYASKSFSSEMHVDVAAIRAFSLWKRMLDLMRASNSLDQALLWQAHSDILSLSSHGLLRREGTHGDKSQESILATVGQDTEALLRQVLQESQIDSDSVHYIQQAYLSVMFAWTKQQEERIMNSTNSDTEELVMDVTRAALSTEALLVEMKEMGLNPQPAHYHAVVQAYKNCLNKNVLLSDRKGKVGEDLLPHVSCFELLDEMEKECLVNEEESRGDIVEKIAATIYEDVIHAFVMSVHDEGSLSELTWTDRRRVKNIFTRMMDLYEQDVLWIDRNKQPLTSALNNILRVYSQTKTRHNESFKESSFLLQRFCKLEPRQGGRQNPNLSTYLYYLSSLSKSNTKDAGLKALDVLKEMEKYSIKPDIAAYTLLIKVVGNRTDTMATAGDLVKKAMAEYDSLSDNEKRKSGFNASALYSSLISAQIKQKVNKGGFHFNVLKYLNERYDETGDPNLKPDIILYGIILDSISRQRGSKSNVSRSLDLLDRLESMYKRGESDLMPTKQCYTSVITTLSKSHMDNALEQAEAILQRMESLYERTGDESTKPDHITYSAILRTISRSKPPIDIERAEDIMNIMEEKAKKSEIPWPNASAYTSLIHSFKNSGLEDLGEKASLTIERMDEAHTHGNYTVKVDTIAFNAAISAWALSNSPEKAVKAWELLNDMCNRYEKGDIACKPNLQSFKLVLHVCGHTTRRLSSYKNSVRVALQTQDKLLRNPGIYDKPDGEFFEKLIKAFGRNIQDKEEKRNFISLAFERCAKEGLVDESVLETLKRCSPQLHRNLPIVSGKVSITKLPKEWWRNTKVN